MKRTNGITLIALIITIIVILILAGVALATLTGQGNIIGNAENVVGKYNNSVKGEQQLLNTIEKYLENYTNRVEGVEEDKNKPIVTATEGEETIEEGADNEISKYFTIDQNGTSSIKTVVYADTSDGDKEVTNTNTLSLGTHTIKCTVTKETGLSSSATKTIVVEKARLIPEADFGQYVTNYTTPSGDPDVKWRIFYADEENVYLIASDYIRYDYAPTGKEGTPLAKSSITEYGLSFYYVVNDYNTGAANITDSRITKWINYVKDNSEAKGNGIQSVAFMLDEPRWSAKYANPEYAEYAIGGPTLELWCASYKASHPDKYLEPSYDDTGYLLKWSDSTGSPSNYVSAAEDEEDLYYIKLKTDKASEMWLASPSSVGDNNLMTINSYGIMRKSYYDSSTTGFRPIVCLQSGIQLEKQSDGTYLIK